VTTEGRTKMSRAFEALLENVTDLHRVGAIDKETLQGLHDAADQAVLSPEERTRREAAVGEAVTGARLAGQTKDPEWIDLGQGVHKPTMEELLKTSDYSRSKPAEESEWVDALPTGDELI